MSEVRTDPWRHFIAEWKRAEVLEPFDASRCVLATVDASGVPDARFVLFKDVGRDAFTFFTNYRSAKAMQMRDEPHAAIAFHWFTTGVQVRARGPVRPLQAEVSDAYFATRARGSQLGAWASRQSEVLRDRNDLEQAVTDADVRFAGVEVPRPEFWGGYEIVPSRIEFWENRESRLHDRVVYEREASGWCSSSLWP